MTVDPTVQTSWEDPEPELVTFQIKIHDHGQVYDFTFTATDLRYALATLLIEHHIYLSSADGLEITSEKTDE